MRLALREARRAVEHDDVPIGCVIVLDDEMIAAAGNERELRNSPRPCRDARHRAGDQHE